MVEMLVIDVVTLALRTKVKLIRESRNSAIGRSTADNDLLRRCSNSSRYNHGSMGEDISWKCALRERNSSFKFDYGKRTMAQCGPRNDEGETRSERTNDGYSYSTG